MTMGLDITAYGKVTLKEAVSLEELKKKDWQHPLYDDGRYQFLYSAHGQTEQNDGMAEGFYEPGGSRPHAFRAGSYHGYNEWRRMLASLVGKTPDEVWAASRREGRTRRPDAVDDESVRSLPFFELINFSDCEGFIGPKTSAKLAADFKRMRSKAEAAFDEDRNDAFMRCYDDWQRAFELASQGGVVLFH
jgi:hypothetical protein